MKLLFDRGNSSVKWAAVEADQWQAEGRLELDGDGHVRPADLQALPQPDSLWLASVARDERDAQLAEQLQQQWDLPVQRVVTRASACGVRCAYAEPARLGVDRWLAVLAAHAGGRDAVVIDAGTAITVDAVRAGGEHLGGVIAPGIGLMRRSLYASTDRIPDEGEATVEFLGRDTRAAVSSGTLQAAAGMINAVVRRLQGELDAECRILLTGGDAERLRPLLEFEPELRPRLVLEGLLRAAACDEPQARDD